MKADGPFIIMQCRHQLSTIAALHFICTLATPCAYRIAPIFDDAIWVSRITVGNARHRHKHSKEASEHQNKPGSGAAFFGLAGLGSFGGFGFFGSFIICQFTSSIVLSADLA